ncbi:hypothetical protein BGZ94_001025 [Podila epigama]|nr:hypothetical protein BGZ94_001025 [Podila epigama]
MAPSDRMKYIIDTEAEMGERVVAILQLKWDYNACTFTIENCSSREISFDIKYRDDKDNERNAGKVRIMSEAQHSWDPVTNCAEEGHTFVVADGKEDFAVQHYEGSYNVPQRQGKSNYFDGCQYAP